MSSIFISYRRDETKDVAGRLYDRLTNIFGKDKVFRDIYTIPGGADFPSWIEDAVASAKVVVALIGDHWATMGDSQHRRRIDDPADWVRLEIATALEHGTLVVPVLVEDATMPAETELPDPLRKLARHHAIGLSDRRFEADVEELIKLLRERVPGIGSQHLQPGDFRKLGTFHVHIDGDDQAHIESLIEELGPKFPSKGESHHRRTCSWPSAGRSGLRRNLSLSYAGSPGERRFLGILHHDAGCGFEAEPRSNRHTQTHHHRGHPQDRPGCRARARRRDHRRGRRLDRG
ncbi:MAG: TIR domain-containing protein [Pseudonocardiaceae bacterium]